MTTSPDDTSPLAGPAAPFRVLVSGALHLLPEIDKLLALGTEVIASDRDAGELAKAADGRATLRCLLADLDLTLDAHRLAVTLRKSDCDVIVHHMGSTGDASAAEGATAFLRAMRLIHAVRTRMSYDWAGLLVLTGCPEGCARSLGIVLDRAGAFCAGANLNIMQCAPSDLPDLLTERRLAVAADRGRTRPDNSALALAS